MKVALVGRAGQGVVVALAALFGFAVAAAPAAATPVSTILTSTNGEGSFDPTIACPAGDGPSWRYAYSGVSNPLAGPFGGTWNSTVEVHDAGARGAFIPDGTGRLRVSVDRGGAANFELDGGGDCSSAPLTLDTQADGDPVATGTLPLHATGGFGSMRGFTGSGSATFSFELGPGADNVAQVDLSGDFGVRQPNLILGSPVAYWRNLTEYLFGKLTVVVPVTNTGDAAASGDAFAVALKQATLSGRSPYAGIPASLGRIDAGVTKYTEVRFAGTAPLKTYNLAVRIEGTDALDAPFAPVVTSAAVKSPLLP